MLLPFGNGITYTELQEVRRGLYGEAGPKLVRETLGRLANITEEFSFTDLAELNNLTRDLGALDPRWTPFSVDVFHAYFTFSYTGNTPNIGKLKESFDRCANFLTQDCAA